MRSSELRALALGVLALAGCAQHDAATLALRDRIEQGALTPDDVPRFRPAPEEWRAANAAASEAVPRLATALDRDLLQAAARGDAVALKAALAQGAQANAVDELGRTALLLVAGTGDLESARLLLRAGAEPDGRDGPLTPLGAAALRGHAPMVRLLLARGARVDAAAPQGLTPLQHAVKLNHLAVAELLLKAGASTTVLDRSGEGLLVNAISADRPDMLALLLRHGLNPNRPDADGLSALYWARQLQREHLVPLLTQAGADPARERVALRPARPYPQEED